MRDQPGLETNTGKRRLKKRLLVKDWHEEKHKTDPDYAREYDALNEEVAIASAVIEARLYARLTQTELAEKMGTSQAHIARLEGGKLPSMRTLEKLTAATGTQIKVRFEPQRP